MVAAFLWVSWEVGAGVLGAAFWAPLSVCFKPTPGFNCCKTTQMGMSESGCWEVGALAQAWVGWRLESASGVKGGLGVQRWEPV